MPDYAATNTKKFLDAAGLAHFAQRLNQYPTNDVIEAVVDGIQDALDEKVDTSKVGQANGVASLNADGKVPSSQLPADANTTYTITQDQTDGHKFTLTGTDGSSTTITIPDNNTTYTLSSLGIGNVKNYDQSKAIKTITRSGNTFTYTCLDNTTGTFDQKDDDTWIAFVGASATAAGTAGYVPAPGKGNQGKFFRGDGLWAVPENTNTTYSISQDSEDGHKFTLTGSDGSTKTITIPDENTTYSAASQSAAGLMSAADKKKLDGVAAGATANVGTITGITMNGASKGTSGIVDLGTVITAHQDVSGKLNANLKGVAGGVAELDENGRVPSSQLPSYVDDVLEYNGRSAFPATGEAGKIYVDISTDGGNKTYRWSGSTYTEISPSLTLGTTSSTAFRGDRGNTAYAHAVTNKGSAFESGLYKITTNAEGHVTGASPVVKDDITALGIPSTNTTYTFDGTYNASTNKAATVKTVTDAIGALDGGTIGTGGAGKTITALSQTDGNVSATFGNISITKSQVSDLGTIGAAAAKGVDTSIAAASTSTNLPTSKAVAAFVEGKGYKTVDTNTTYTISQDSTDGHKFTLTGSDGSTTTITIPDNNTTYTLSSLGIGNVKNYDQSKAIKSITRSGTTFTYTCLDNTTGTFTQKDDNTWVAFAGASASANGTAGYVPAPGKGNQEKFFRGDGTWAVPTNTNTTYTIAQDSTDGHKFTLSGSDGSSTTITIPDNDHTYTLSSLGIGNVKNYDQSKAIKSITRSGTTFTYTCLDNTTGTFTQQDNNTWTAFVGASASANGTAGYVPAAGKGNQEKFFKGNGTWDIPTNTTYTITQDSTDGHKFTLAGSDGSTTTITIPDNNTTYTLSSLGIENVKNYDQSKAIKSITRSGTTFTYTCLDNTTGTFTQQDNNTWTAMVGATSSANGTAGYVPAPPKDGYNTKYLRADGSWSIPPDNNTDTKVTSVGNHYTPAADENAALTASASGATAAWSIDVVKGVTLSRDAKGHVTGVSVTSGKIPGNPNTDTKVTSAANHYTPATATGSDVTASAADGTPAWSEDFVKGVTLNTDGKGHVTGMTVTSGKLPANPNTDTKNTAGSKNTSSKIFLIGATSQATNPVTYSHDTAYVGTDGCLYSGGSKVLTEHQDISGKANLASPALTGTPTAPTAAAGTNNTQIATTAFVTSAVAASFAANDAMLFKGTIGTSGSGATLTALPTTHNQGWTYKVITAGTYASKPCEVGDMIICIVDGTTASDDDWTVVQSNIDGAVVGPASAVTDRVATFSNTSGKVIKDSGFTIGKSVPSNAVFTDASVTSVANHYTPARDTSADKSASASGATAAWSIDVVKGVTLQTDGKGHVTGVAVTSGKIPANPNTDTKVTSAANHYTPAADTDSKLTANATGATAAWGIDVVKGVALERDAKGHVVALTVTSGKLPSLGTSSTTAAKGNHTHTTSIATSSGTSQITLSASTKYILTAGGTSYIFTTPPNTTYTAITDAEIDSIWSS